MIVEFVKRREQPFARCHLDAHVTASAFIVDPTGGRVLLGHHRKLARWLQLGGHGEEGDSSAGDVALREACEESGMDGFVFHPLAPRPFDVDVHSIPPRPGVPGHDHLDLRYLLVAPAESDPRRRDNEHLEVRWFPWDEALAVAGDAAFVRAMLKARVLCAPASA